MRVPIYTAVLPILAGLACAQDTPPAQPKQPAESAAPAAAQEMKTQTYSGTLMDASCAKPGSAPTATASADRTAGSDNSQGCTVSASTSQFALKMKDGNTVRLDDVGNMRVQEAMKSRKKWGDLAAASKPIQVKVSGVMSGDKLTALSVN